MSIRTRFEKAKGAPAGAPWPTPIQIVEAIHFPGELVTLADYSNDEALRIAAVAEIARRYKLRAIRWAFDGDQMQEHEGFTDDTRWNGFLNVWVTPKVHRDVIHDMDPEFRGEFRDMVTDDRGLYSYADGFTSHEVEPE